MAKFRPGTYLPDDNIINQGAVGSNFYFILKGNAKVL